MATQLPSPPSTPQPESKDDPTAVQEEVLPAVASEDLGDGIPLSKRLDQLLESYLQLLDTYTTLRDQLSKDLSAGFFALASANRNSSLGPGRRYGEEGYDQRMKALRTVQIGQNTRAFHSSQGAKEEQKIDTEEATQVTEEASTEGHPAETPSPSDLETQHGGVPFKTESQESHKQNDSKSISSSNPTHNTSHLPPCYNYTIHTTTPPLPAKDPLKWYGILVPPPLRQCQTHFQHVVSSSIPDLLSTTSEMQHLEEQIWGLRRELGLSEGYKEQDIATKGSAGTTSADQGGEEEDDLAQSSLSLSKDGSSSRRQVPVRKASLLSPSSPARPAEPRSRILKLG